MSSVSADDNPVSTMADETSFPCHILGEVPAREVLIRMQKQTSASAPTISLSTPPSSNADDETTREIRIGIILFHGTWNKLSLSEAIYSAIAHDIVISKNESRSSPKTTSSLRTAPSSFSLFSDSDFNSSRPRGLYMISVLVDRDEESIKICIGEDNAERGDAADNDDDDDGKNDSTFYSGAQSGNCYFWKVPPKMPALAVVLLNNARTDDDDDDNDGNSHGQEKKEEEKNEKKKDKKDESEFTIAKVEFVDVDSGVLWSYLRCIGCGNSNFASDDNYDDKVITSMVLPKIRKTIKRMIRERENSIETDQSTENVPIVRPPLPTSTDELHGEHEALRIFISGDRSQVGKSTVCLGLLGSLMRLGYPPSSLGYIKPATQCEATQPVAVFCDKVGIESVPVGPIVYFKGFTRAFLAGETEGTNALLSKAGRAVDDLARGKRVIIIDGVGYPSVGSICGTDNASVAGACGGPVHDDRPDMDEGNDRVGDQGTGHQMPLRTPAPVLIVGKSGVGDAVDSFNLNATYFEHSGVPVLGAVFNRLSLEGFYSLDNCRKAVTAYFEQYRPDQKAFGFIPDMTELSKSCENGDDKNESDRADEVIDTFMDYVDVRGILDAANDVSKRQHQELSQGRCLHTRKEKGSEKVKIVNPSSSKAKRPRLEDISPVKLTREQIEQAAMSAGAAAAGG